MTPKQTRFVEEYLLDLNATQAAVRAGYSEKTAQEQSSRLLSNVMVRAAINARQADVAKETNLTVASVTAKLLSIAEKAEKMDSAPGLGVARQSLMDAAKLNGLIVDTSETITRSPEERAARLAALKAERERISTTH